MMASRVIPRVRGTVPRAAFVLIGAASAVRTFRVAVPRVATPARLLVRPGAVLPRRYLVISEPHEAKIYDFAAIKELVAHPRDDAVLVDVREPLEFAEGHIAHAVNVPYKTCPGALSLPEEDFEDYFGFAKPDPAKELVFYCLGGVRSLAAEELASTFGYEKRGNYLGLYEDWVANGGEVVKPPAPKL